MIRSFSSGATLSRPLSLPGLSATLIQERRTQSPSWSMYLAFPASLSPSSLHLSQTSPSQGSAFRLQGPSGAHSRGCHRLPFLCRQVWPCSVCHKQQLKAFRHGPSSLELTGREEVLIFTITFMLSTWWIKNPFLKNKIIDVWLVFLNSV